MLTTTRITRLGGDGFALGLLTVSLSLALLLADTYLIVANPALGLGLRLIVFLILGIARFEYAAVALMCTLVFQNTAIAIVAPEPGGPFNILRGAPFLDRCVLFAVSVVLGYRERIFANPEIRGLIKLSAATLAALAVFFVIGAASNPTSALTYLRGALSCVLFLCIGFAATTRPKVVFCGAIALLSLMVIFAIVEFFAGYWLYESLHLVHYMGLKGSGQKFDFTSTAGMIEALSVKFLNAKMFADLDFEYVRLMGPNLHTISFSYALGVLALVALQCRWRALALLAIVAMVIAGSKGAIVTVLFAIAAPFALGPFRKNATLAITAAAGVLGVYVVGWTIYGLAAGDYHVIGLMGGVKGFLSNPIGHGLGAGGNLGGEREADIVNKWQTFQRYGADYGLESAVGVMLYQIGLATILPLALCAKLGARLVRLGNIRLGFALLATAANAFFQEEALFAPLSIGLLALFAGMEIAASSSSPQSRSVPSRRRQTHNSLGVQT